MATKRQRRKPTGKKRPPKPWTARAIVDLWKAASRKGLGSKRFERAIYVEYEPRLLARVSSHLSGPPPLPPHPFTRRDEFNTKSLAFILGVICRLVTVEKEVSIDTFQKAFELVKGSPKCPGGGGGGEWCAI
jgi:hypothetical protein